MVIASCITPSGFHPLPLQHFVPKVIRAPESCLLKGGKEAEGEGIPRIFEDGGDVGRSLKPETPR